MSGQGVLGVIPARLGSSRLPRKPLQPLAGRPLIEWVWRRATSYRELDELVVATDSAEIQEAVENFGGRAVLTRVDHSSGTDRVAEVARRDEFSGYTWIVNLQGDEPFTPAEAVSDALKLVRSDWEIATLAVPIEEVAEWRDPSAVKVVVDDRGSALYFSRAPIPHAREGGGQEDRVPDVALRHVGFYAFTRDALERAASLPVNRLEELEGLEQLRWLAAGMRIGVVEAGKFGSGVDTPEDLARAEEILEMERRGP